MWLVANGRRRTTSHACLGSQSPPAPSFTLLCILSHTYQFSVWLQISWHIWVFSPRSISDIWPTLGTCELQGVRAHTGHSQDIDKATKSVGRCANMFHIFVLASFSPPVLHSFQCSSRYATISWKCRIVTVKGRHSKSFMCTLLSLLIFLTRMKCLEFLLNLQYIKGGNRMNLFSTSPQNSSCTVV